MYKIQHENLLSDSGTRWYKNEKSVEGIVSKDELDNLFSGRTHPKQETVENSERHSCALSFSSLSEKERMKERQRERERERERDKEKDRQ